MKLWDYKVIVVDGIIGAGKTCLIENCLLPKLTEQGYRVKVILEPVEKWKECGALSQFYSDMERRSFQFQIRVFHDRIKECRRIYEQSLYKTDIFILERSIFTDVVFSKMLHQDGFIDDSEYREYKDLWEMWRELMPFTPDLFLYLRPDIDVAMDRLRLRGRDEEKNLSESYQEKLQKEHDNFFREDILGTNGIENFEILKIETNENFKSDEKVKENIVNTVLHELY